jgi:hypothetical protein
MSALPYLTPWWVRWTARAAVIATPERLAALAPEDRAALREAADRLLHNLNRPRP